MNRIATLVILNYNTRDLTLKCLSQFVSDLDTNWQVIVVDNASTDGSADAIAIAYPSVKLIRSNKNLGFSGGNNLGITQAQGDVVILLNSDVIVTAKTLTQLSHMLMANADVGILSPKLLTAQGRPQAFAYGQDPSVSYLLKRGWNALIWHKPLHDWNIQKPIVTDWVSGACLCAKKIAIDQVGLMDDQFFLYFEDNDWCLRMRQKDWKIVYDPHYQVTHLGGASEQHRGKANQFYYQSLLHFYKKHYSGVQYFLLKWLLVAYQVLNKS